MSIIDILKIKAEGEIAAKNKELELEERRLALEERRFKIQQEERQEERERKAMLEFQNSKRLEAWELN